MWRRDGNWPQNLVSRYHPARSPAAAPAIAFLVSAIHKLLAAEFNPVLRAMVLTGIVVILDAVVVAPIFERSYAMFRSFIGTWMPFAAIFLTSWAAGFLVLA